MVNTKHDTTSYESCGYLREISDGNALYDAYLHAKQGSDWKSQIQKYEMTYLFGLAEIQQNLNTRNYRFLPGTDFVINERGKTRYVTGEQFPDRIVKHCLCDEILTPSVYKYLIYDNGANIKNKGIDFTRRRLLVHLRKYYAQHRSNEGYILLIDFSKYYDNIRHDVLIDIFQKYVHSDQITWLLQKIINYSRVDVSHMSDSEYKTCMTTVFDSLEYRQIDKSLLTGEKFMDKHLNIGDQFAQVAGIVYPIPIDNFIKIVKGVKFYGRYTDDSYIIHESKEFLQDLLNDIVRIANSIGITINTHKTRICRLSDYWRFLQIQYSLTESGRIVQKINPKRLTCMRRKMKKLIHVLTPKEFDNWFYSWFCNHCKYMSKLQRENLIQLYSLLKTHANRKE